MAQLVNYKKRDFALPSGCKNLMDVLAKSGGNTKSQKANSTSPSPGITEEQFARDGLIHVSRYVSKLMQPRKKFSLLTLSSRKSHVSVRLHRFKNKPLGNITFVDETPKCELAIRVFFGQKNIKVSLDCNYSASNAAGDGRLLTYPLPADPASVTVLTVELLRSVYGMTDAAALDFYYYED